MESDIPRLDKGTQKVGRPIDFVIGADEWPKIPIILKENKKINKAFGRFKYISYFCTRKRGGNLLREWRDSSAG